MTFKVSVDFTDDERHSAIQAIVPNMCDSCKAKAKAENSQKLSQSDFCFIDQGLIETQLEKMAGEELQAAIKVSKSADRLLIPGNFRRSD